MKKGFSIIEFLIYIAILSIAITAMGLVSLNVFRVGVKNDVVQEVSHNGRFAIQKIGQAVRVSSVIVGPETQGNRLELEDPDKNSIVFDVSEGKLRITEGGEANYLTTSRVIVDKIIFKKISEDSVRVEMNISFNDQDLPEYKFNSFFTSSFTLKN